MNSILAGGDTFETLYGGEDAVRNTITLDLLIFGAFSYASISVSSIVFL